MNKNFWNRGLALLSAAGLLLLTSCGQKANDPLQRLTTQEPDQNQQEGSNESFLAAQGYTWALLTKVQNAAKTEDPDLLALAEQLPAPWNGYVLESISDLTTDQITLNYHAPLESILGYTENPFSAAIRENNALLLFAVSKAISQITFFFSDDAEEATYTREELQEAYSDGASVLAMKDLNTVELQLSEHLLMEEFYFAHAGRLYLEKDTRKEITYREGGEPLKITKNAKDLTVLHYEEIQERISEQDPTAEPEIITTISRKYYVDKNEKFVAYHERYSDLKRYNELIGSAEEPETEATLQKKYGTPAPIVGGENTYYFFYRLRGEGPEELPNSHYAFFELEREHNTVIATGFMVGCNPTDLLTEVVSVPELTPNFYDPASKEAQALLKPLIWGSDGWRILPRGDVVFAQFHRYLLRYSTKTNQVEHLVHLGDLPQGCEYLVSFSPDGNQAIVEGYDFLGGYGDVRTKRVALDFTRKTSKVTEKKHFENDLENKPQKVGLREFGDKAAWFLSDKEDNPIKELTALNSYAVAAGNATAEGVLMDDGKRVALIAPTTDWTKLGTYEFLILDIATDKIIQRRLLGSK